MTLDMLTIALIRALQPRSITSNHDDETLIEMYGPAAQPLADAIRETIHEELVRTAHTA